MTRTPSCHLKTMLAQIPDPRNDMGMASLLEPFRSHFLYFCGFAEKCRDSEIAPTGTDRHCGLPVQE